MLLPMASKDICLEKIIFLKFVSLNLKANYSLFMFFNLLILFWFETEPYIL